MLPSSAYSPYHQYAFKCLKMAGEISTTCYPLAVQIQLGKELMNHTKKITTTVLLALLALTAPAIAAAKQKQKPSWTIEGLDQPESVVALDDGKILLISNINGAPMELNGKGYITQATNKGRIVNKRWVEGLDAPKGMAVHDGNLYVADMQTLHVVDIASGKIVKQYQAPKAKMLNDVTVSDDGLVYVSDLIGGGIYRLQESTFALWFDSPQLPHPNGLLWDEGSLLVGGWGQGLGDDFTTEVPGTLYRLDPGSKSLVPVPEGYQLGNLDGVVKIDQDIYVSDWVSGVLYRLGGNERVKTLKLNAGLADIGAASEIIYAPMMMDGTVTAWDLRKSRSQSKADR